MLLISRRDALKIGSAAIAAAALRPANAFAAPAWHEEGTDFPELRVFDERMREFMQREGVSAAQLAIANQGVLVYNRAYTWTSGRRNVVTENLFRIASCSKLFTCAALDALRNDGRLDLSARVFPLLGIDSPALATQRPDRHINDITVQHLVDHAGGWNDHDACTASNGERIPGTDWDPVFSIRQITNDLGLHRLPRKLEIARYMYGKPLQFVPGTQNFNSTRGKSYSNIGYMLLGLVVEIASGQDYVDYVRSVPLAHDGTSDVFLAHTAAARRLPREVWYEDSGSGPSALAPWSPEVAPNPYGGEGFVTELMDSGGGLCTSAGTLARFIARHATWGLGGRAPGAERSGSMAGTSSYAMSRSNGVDCAVILNTRSFRSSGDPFGGLMNQVRTLCDTRVPRRS